jgi:hypothetical protein
MINIVLETAHAILDHSKSQRENRVKGQIDPREDYLLDYRDLVSAG